MAKQNLIATLPCHVSPSALNGATCSIKTEEQQQENLMRLLIDIPTLPPHVTCGSRSKTFKTLALRAIETQMPPYMEKVEGEGKFWVDLTDCSEEVDAGLAAAAKMGITARPEEVLRGYCLAALLQQQVPQEPTTQILRERPEQTILRDSIEKSLAKGNIVIAEAATGVGKGLVIGKIAEKRHEEFSGPVVVAAPTIQVVKQLLGQWMLIKSTTKAHVTVAFGKNQFVDPEKLSTLLDDPESCLSESARAKAKEWLAAGAKPLPGQDTEVIREVFPPIAYLSDDLIRLSPEFEETAHFCLDGIIRKNTENPAEIIYNQMRKAALQGDIVFTTHAMLAYDLLNTYRNGINLLTPYDTLIIDEAHLLRTNIENVQREELSILSLRHLLKTTEMGAKTNREKGIGLCVKIMQNAKIAGPEASIELSPKNWNDGEVPQYIHDNFTQLGKLLEVCERLLPKESAKSRDNGANKDANEMLHAVICLKKLLKRDQLVSLNISPVRSYPTFISRPLTINPLLDSIWNRGAKLSKVMKEGFIKVVKASHHRTMPAIQLLENSIGSRPWRDEVGGESSFVRLERKEVPSPHDGSTVMYTWSDHKETHFQAITTPDDNISIRSLTKEGKSGTSIIAPSGKILADPKLKGAVLLSATMFLPKVGENRNASYMQNQLQIPTERFDPLPSVSPEWVYSPVTLHHPGYENTQKALSYPARAEYKATAKDNRRLDADLVRWSENVAGRIKVIADQAKGGTLVLCSSYDDIDAFASKLQSLENRLIIQKRRGRFSADRETYLTMAAGNRRPVWLALGTAWTGLDLSDPTKYGKTAKDDNFLTDLVVARIPFSPMLSATGKRLRLGTSTYRQTLSFTEAAFMFRQGIGRLVRKPGMQEKHLWVLDPRVWTRDKKLYGVFLRILDVYSNRTEF